ncbi:hypothetical protein PHYBLDRAFT_62247 [Phycomyces blakesleeanus NRRL 1555(-)]|uniref:Uncharacterized protein n=1 Tax=Phycomyces blakesleeanus (strain ATCC 8743b / DSM 1359 / FGSC 10004 / NBRC 33097 / NRRL 1555) TaxID=763407 RepID=A0A167Q345_PHYB8|nr:hypothetical protein PHYBLDRAFT_62247 [Phycomyces blakesleeanus NRRL 1555(-)]OAD78984.1 hypothetical protein PHYBLDRAFT_62247 [Phycomyces blakesleeanus NRRL 1555(-)]|eukprot:XP_018297024.1 hypothetical protein PHYBLDRAFT_62247 [Phycomyces blakesleeanus NRRL 1555(-)]
MTMLNTTNNHSIFNSCMIILNEILYVSRFLNQSYTVLSLSIGHFSGCAQHLGLAIKNTISIASYAEDYKEFLSLKCNAILLDILLFTGLLTTSMKAAHEATNWSHQKQRLKSPPFSRQKLKKSRHAKILSEWV